MRYVKRSLIALLVCAVLVTALPVGGTGYAEQSGVSTANEGQTVRVGMYVKTSVLDTRRFSARNSSQSGFELGYSDGSGFHQIFKTTAKEIIILPCVNAEIDYGSVSGDGAAGGGNFIACSKTVSRHSSYSAAASAAKKYEGGFVAAVNGGFEARTSSPTGTPESGSIAVLDVEKQSILFVFADPSRTFALRASGDGAVTLPMKHRSGSVNNYEYPGYFEYSVEDGLLRMINCLGLELYTKCVMANEIGGGFTKETRRAFSILARTFALGHKHSEQGFDVCPNSACCQVYAGFFRMSEENNAIVDSTSGLICVYNGKPITVLYTGANGGASCSSVAAWGGNEVPYLTTVFLENDDIEESSKWEKVFTRTEFYDYLSSRASFAALADDEITMKILDTDPYGSDYITVLSVSDGGGNTVTIENSEKVRSAVGFSSANFKIKYVTDTEVLTSDGTVSERRIEGIMTAEGYKEFDGFGDSYELIEGGSIAPDKVIISGVGSGHGVGFSATGSEKLSLEGYNYKYILNFFFNGTEIVSA